MKLYSWRADRKATRAHIAESIQYALAEKRLIGGKSDAWYAAACDVSRRWRDECRAMTVKTLARRHLDYWRMRAFLGVDSTEGGSYAPRGWPWDRPAHRKWNAMLLGAR